LISLFLIGYRGANEIASVESDDVFAKVVEHNPELFITVWNMPLADSVEFISRVRTDQDAPETHLPIIMLIGYTEMHRIRWARVSDISPFLAKRVSAQALYKGLI